MASQIAMLIIRISAAGAVAGGDGIHAVLMCSPRCSPTQRE